MVKQALAQNQPSHQEEAVQSIQAQHEAMKGIRAMSLDQYVFLGKRPKPTAR